MLAGMILYFRPYHQHLAAGLARLLKDVMRGRAATIATTALVPILWGSTYIVTSEWLPPDRPFTTAAIRCLPAGLLLVAAAGGILKRNQILPVVVLALLNITIFQGFLFTAANLLPGGIASLAGALQPLLVLILVWWLDRSPPTPVKLAAAAVAVIGMAMLLAGPGAGGQWDPKGLAAALVATVSVSIGLYLSGKWRQDMGVISLTGWQLLIGGLFLLPVALVTEEPLHGLSATNLAGYGYISVFGTLIGYLLWFRGVRLLSPATVSSLGLLSPVTATFLGWTFLGECLGTIETIGIAIVLGSVFALQTRRPAKHSGHSALSPSENHKP